MTVPFRHSRVSVSSIQHAIAPASGHFAQEEAPEATWHLLAEFASA